MSSITLRLKLRHFRPVLCRSVHTSNAAFGHPSKIALQRMPHPARMSPGVRERIRGKGASRLNIMKGRVTAGLAITHRGPRRAARRLDHVIRTLLNER